MSHFIIHLATTIGGAGKNIGAQASQAGGGMLMAFGGLKALVHFMGDRAGKVAGTAILAIAVGAFFFAAPTVISFIKDSSHAIGK